MKALVPEKVLTAQEEKAIDTKINELKDMRDGVEVQQGLEHEVRNRPELDAQIKRLEAVKASQALPELNGSEMQRVSEEEKLLRDDLQKDMPTWHTYVGLTPRDGARYPALVQKIVEWEKNPIRRSKIQRWKTLRRLINREDPKFASTMHLFPQ